MDLLHALVEPKGPARCVCMSFFTVESGQVVETLDAEHIDENQDVEIVDARLYKRVLRLARSSPLFAVGLVFVLVAVFLAISRRTRPLDNPIEPSSDVLSSVAQRAATGSARMPAGLDVFSRVLAAARVDPVIALAATTLSFVVGAAIGLLASFLRGLSAGSRCACPTPFRRSRCSSWRSSSS